MHGCFTRCADAAPADDRSDRAGENLEVEAKRQVIHVPDIHGQPLVPREGVAPVHLGQAR